MCTLKVGPDLYNTSHLNADGRKEESMQQSVGEEPAMLSGLLLNHLLLFCIQSQAKGVIEDGLMV